MRVLSTGWLTRRRSGDTRFFPPGPSGPTDSLPLRTREPSCGPEPATVSRPVADTVEAAYLSGLRAASQVSAILRHP